MNELPRALRKLQLNPVEASEYLSEAYGLKRTVATLKWWRARRPDQGPPFERFGRNVVYRRLGLDQWAQAQRQPGVAR